MVRLRGEGLTYEEIGRLCDSISKQAVYQIIGRKRKDYSINNKDYPIKRCFECGHQNQLSFWPLTEWKKRVKEVCSKCGNKLFEV